MKPLVKNTITFEKNTKCSRNVHFHLIPEETLPFAEKFKEFEEEIHHGADQDVDTDEENVESARSTSLKQLTQAIDEYQRDPKAVDKISNVILGRPLRSRNGLPMKFFTQEDFWWGLWHRKSALLY